MLQYLFDTLRIINAGYDLYPTTALVTLINLYGEDSLQSLRPEQNSASSNSLCSYQIA